MKILTYGLLAVATAAILAGCGGTAASPALGTAQSPRVRAINLIPTSGPLTATYDNFTPAIGTISGNQVTGYSVENEGSNTVTFSGTSGSITSYAGVFQYGSYSTVAIYQKGATFGTFTLNDNSSAINTGLCQLRLANAITTATTPVDVYVTPGSSGAPTLVSSNLISSGGLAFAAATDYKTYTPGAYTVTVTPQNVSTSVLLNVVVNPNAGQSITVYAEDGQLSVNTTDDQ